MPSGDATDSTRLDKWLWAARFFRTRSLAAEAIDGGKVEVNGEKAKRARPLRPGDRIRLRQGPYEFRLRVLALSARRGPAAEAAALYEEEPEGRAVRERIAEQHRQAARLLGQAPKGRPTKKDRRDFERFRDGG